MTLTSTSFSQSLPRRSARLTYRPSFRWILDSHRVTSQAAARVSSAVPPASGILDGRSTSRARSGLPALAAQHPWPQPGRVGWRSAPGPSSSIVPWARRMDGRSDGETDHTGRVVRTNRVRRLAETRQSWTAPAQRTGPPAFAGLVAPWSASGLCPGCRRCRAPEEIGPYVGRSEAMLSGGFDDMLAVTLCRELQAVNSA
jgi:hypothetical protein